MTGGLRDAERSAPRTEPLGGCPVCGGQEASPLFEAPDRLMGVPGSFRYRRCRICRSVAQDPVVVDADTDVLYPEGYYTHSGAGERLPLLYAPPARTLRRRLRADVVGAVTGEAGARGVGALLARRRWIRERAFFDLVPDEMIPRRRPAGRALDVGCGSGRLLARLQALGWEAEGVEPDARAARAAAEATGLPVHVARAGELPDDLGAFSLVTLSHVFEHLRDPVGVLRSLGERLEPGGRVVLLWPNPDALGARRWGKDWFAWDPPRHLVLPSAASLPGLARSAGLHLRSVRTSARQAAMNATQSRLYRQSRRSARREPGWRERGFAALETLLVAVGAGVGEEVVAVLERPGP